MFHTGIPIVRERKKTPTPKNNDAAVARDTSLTICLSAALFVTSYTKKFPEKKSPTQRSTTES
eukprot:m.36888 g.36888  ORF g.36888 m.36888 type:complete len:63 (+) comp10120_c0_seq1:819-1007(+)